MTDLDSVSQHTYTAFHQVLSGSGSQKDRLIQAFNEISLINADEIPEDTRQVIEELRTNMTINGSIHESVEKMDSADIRHNTGKILCLVHAIVQDHSIRREYVKKNC